MFVPALGVRGGARSVVADTASSRGPRSRREGSAGSSGLTVLRSLVVGKVHPYVICDSTLPSIGAGRLLARICTHNTHPCTLIEQSDFIMNMIVMIHVVMYHDP